MKKLSMPRECYLPKSQREVAPIVPEGTDLAIWSWDEGGKPYAICFAGKANKPVWHYRFTSVERRVACIEKEVEQRLSYLKRMAERRTERKSYQHDLRVGDVLYSSWGYDQTNIDFYEVVGVNGKAVEIRKISKHVAGSDNFTSDKVSADVGNFVGEVMVRRPNQYGVKIDDCRTASKWDGKPKHQTAFGYGH